MLRTIHIDMPHLFALALSVIFICGQPLSGSVLSNWRFFSPKEGLAESFSCHVNVDPQGRIWASHGAVGKLSWLDGWPMADGKFVRTMPSPGADLDVVISKGGQIWSRHKRGLLQWRDSSWVSYDIPRFSDFPSRASPLHFASAEVPLIPGNTDKIYYQFPDIIRLFDSSLECSFDVLDSTQAAIGAMTDMLATPDERVWVTGQRGLLELTLAGETVIGMRRYYPPNGRYTGFRAPFATRENGLLTVAQLSGSNRSELVHFQNGEWTVVYEDDSNILAGWQGLDSSYWIAKDRNTLINLLNGQSIIQPREGILSGDIYDVVVEPSGVFWLAASHGLARYAPSIWRVPSSHNDFNNRVHEICQDKSGRLWFGAVDKLLCLDGKQWKWWKLPDGLETQSYVTQSLCPLPDGRLAVGVLGFQEYLLTFDPRQERFERNYYSMGDSSERRIVGHLAPRRDGTVFVEARSLDGAEYRIEVYDGHGFAPFLTLENWQIGNLRHIYETAEGDVWFGGLSEKALAVYSGGEYSPVQREKGFTESGVYSVLQLPDGRIWAGGRNAILEFDGKTWRTVKEGMAGVRSMFCGPDGVIWVASGTGIHRFVDGSWVSNTVADGLPTSESFVVFGDNQDRVWAGTTSGHALYYPETDIDPPETIISRKNNLRETPPHGEVRLLFSGVDKWQQTAAERLLFSWRLDGGAWTPYAQSNIAYYSGLQAGNHQFETRAMDVNLNYDTEPAEFKFKVLPPWYKEAGFQAIFMAGTTIIALLLGIAIHRHVLLEKLVRDRTKELHESNIQLSDNVEELKRTEKDLNREQEHLQTALGHERSLANVASQLNSSDQFFKLINKLMETVGTALKVDAVALFSQDSGSREAGRIALWHDKDLPASCDIPSKIDLSTYDVLMRNLPGHPLVKVDDCEGLPPAEAGLMRTMGVGSIIFLPIRVVEKSMGIVWLVRNKPTHWDAEDEELCKTIADMIANAWQRYIHFQARIEAEEKRTEAIQMAEKASRLASMGVMAAGITHEINQPLTSIKFTVDSLLHLEKHNKGILPEFTLKKLAKISSGADRVDSIIKHMRSHWISPDNKLNELIDLSEVVTSGLSLINQQLHSHGIRLSTGLAAEKLEIKGNQVHLEQILINLVVNAMQALDHVSHKEKQINVATEKREGAVCLIVQDNATGISEEHKHKIFDPFYSTKEPGEGSGLGLAVVKRFVDQHGGIITIHNNEQGGATFVVEFPLDPAS